ncbi:Eco29kI family restriction endonuclease [Brevibacterium aurantiacum]|uniref:Eco29kI family restriction endonuclease n=1 Tax=Brevibacterium aurantiacum TaxID=273384 RepID=A0A4Z0KKW7_BREAU|nr:Eco29kI family restriction endonuclease [Brevibacterium aurantiacum]
MAFDPLSYENLGESISRALDQRPVVPINNLPNFSGQGIYALYYSGNFPLYNEIAEKNRQIAGTWPLYIGKAEAQSERKGDPDQKNILDGNRLKNRISSHRTSIAQATNVDISDFSVRYLVVAPTWVPLAEIVSIREHTPVWNSLLDGLGNHAPGTGRKDMQRPKWDMIHPGRPWAAKLRDNDKSVEELEIEVHDFIAQRSSR